MKKIELNDTYGYEDFITDEEQTFLLDWIYKNENNFDVNESFADETHAPYGSRKMCRIQTTKNVPIDFIRKIKKRIIETENIQNWILDPVFNDLITINGAGGSIHSHKDTNIPGRTHVRYNVILKYPTEGGHSIYNGKINILKEKMVWRCVAGKVEHASTPVIGDIPRITLSFGFQIQNEGKTERSIL